MTDIDLDKSNIGATSAVLVIIIILFGGIVMSMFLPVDSSTFYGRQDFLITNKYYTGDGHYYLDMITIKSRCTCTMNGIFGGAMRINKHEVSREVWIDTWADHHIDIDYVCENGNMRFTADGWAV